MKVQSLARAILALSEHEGGNVLGRPGVLRRRGTWVTPTISIRQSRDPDDDTFLECAVAGGADYVVSADTDLLSLRAVQGSPIVNAPAFWQKLSRQAECPE